MVVSQLHYFFEHHGLGETEVYLHADNCTGQNKNNCMMHYLSWRVLTKRHTKITLSFLVVGHTKFAPDWCFGLFKRLYRRTTVGSLKDIVATVNKSAHCNFAQLASKEDGTSVVPVYDWTDFFTSYMKKIERIKTYQHFRFDSSKPGVVYIREHIDKPEFSLDLRKTGWSAQATSFPVIVNPKGLSPARQWYLHDSIRPFCPEGDKDVTCPVPDVQKPSTRAGTPEHTTPVPELATNCLPQHASIDELEPPPCKRKRACRICREEGHNSRTCPEKNFQI